MKRTDVIYSKKEFLNLPGHETVACILTHMVKIDWGKEEDLQREIDYEFVITDCSDNIKLRIVDGTEYDRENSMYKIDTLIDVLTKFRSALVDEFKIQAEMEKKREQLEKEKLEKEK